MSDTKDSITDKLAPVDDDFVDDSTWTPPTEEELKRMEERRKKQDAISKDLGQYLLKGWKMLATYCPNKDCGTVLMQDKEGRDYCVACKVFLKKEKQEEEKKEEATPATPTEPAKEKGIQLTQASKDADGNTFGGEVKSKEPIFKPSFQNYKGKRSGNNKRGGRKSAGAAIPSQEEDDDIIDGAPGKREQHFGTPSAKRARHTDGDVALPAAENPQQRHTVASPRPKLVTVAKPLQNTHFNTTIIALEQKIELLSAELAKASDEQVIKLCQVIQEAAKTVETLVRVKSQFQ